MDLLARIEVDGVCLGGIRLSGVLRPKQVASVGAQTKRRAWAFRLGSSCRPGVSHARCKWLPATCSPYHTSIRARLATPARCLLPVTSNILPTKNMALMMADCCLSSRIKGEAVSDAAGRDSRDIRDGRDWRRKSRLSRSSLMSLESRSAVYNGIEKLAFIRPMVLQPDERVTCRWSRQKPGRASWRDIRRSVFCLW